MKKAYNAPRRLYVRKGVAHVCYTGTIYGTDAETTKVDPAGEVKCEVREDGTCVVKQRKPHAKGVTETWSKVRIPTKARKAA